MKKILEGEWAPGQVFIIDAPICITVNIPSAIKDNKFNESVTFMTNDSHGPRRFRDIKLENKTHNRKATIVRVISPGYVSMFSGTTYAYQGCTLNRIIGDFNKHNNTNIDLNSINVTMSRVREALHFRVMPWSDEFERLKLKNIRFNDTYIIWLNAYDENGIFQNHLIRHNTNYDHIKEKLDSPKIKRNNSLSNTLKKNKNSLLPNKLFVSTEPELSSPSSLQPSLANTSSESMSSSLLPTLSSSSQSSASSSSSSLSFSSQFSSSTPSFSHTTKSPKTNQFWIISPHEVNESRQYLKSQISQKRNGFGLQEIDGENF